MTNISNNISFHELNGIHKFMKDYMAGNNENGSFSKTPKNPFRIGDGREIIAQKIAYEDIPNAKGRNAAMVSKSEVGLEHIKNNIWLLLEAEKPFFLVTGFFSERRCCVKFEIQKIVNTN